MKKFDLREFKLVIFFCALTVLLTIVVILFWEVALRPSFFGWVDTHYPGNENVQRRWDIKQRTSGGKPPS
jgi:hypothetical protein